MGRRAWEMPIRCKYLPYGYYILKTPSNTRGMVLSFPFLSLLYMTSLYLNLAEVPWTTLLSYLPKAINPVNAYGFFLLRLLCFEKMQVFETPLQMSFPWEFGRDSLGWRVTPAGVSAISYKKGHCFLIRWWIDLRTSSLGGLASTGWQAGSSILR